jgi:hypothetical protein
MTDEYFMMLALKKRSLPMMKMKFLLVQSSF